MAQIATPVSRTENVKNIGKAIFGAAILAAALRWLIDAAASVHVAIGAILALVIAAVAIWLMRLVKLSHYGADPIGVVGTLALGLLSFATVCGWVSFTLHTTGIATYSVPSNISAGTFVDLYMFTFINIVPGIEPLDTLYLKPPVESLNWVGGLPILVFKVFVVWLFVDAWVSWRRTARGEHRTSGAASSKVAATV